MAKLVLIWAEALWLGSHAVKPLCDYLKTTENEPTAADVESQIIFKYKGEKKKEKKYIKERISFVEFLQ